MKLSQNMLNFLGYMHENSERWKDYGCERSEAIALAYPFGVASAIKNGLITEVWSDHFFLTKKGEVIGKLGAAMRNLKPKGVWPISKIPGIRFIPDFGFVNHAQLLLDSGILDERTE